MPPMSATAEIADNKWELSSTKPPINSVIGIAQVVMMVSFSLFFGWLVLASVAALFMSPSNELTLEQQYQQMNATPQDR